MGTLFWDENVENQPERPKVNRTWWAGEVLVHSEVYEDPKPRKNPTASVPQRGGGHRTEVLIKDTQEQLRKL